MSEYGLIRMRVGGGLSAKRYIGNWYFRIFKRCIGTDAVAEDWKVASSIPICTGRGNRRMCAKYR